MSAAAHPLEPSAIVSAERIMALSHAFRGAKALLSAVELGLFTALAEGVLDFDVQRTKLGIAERGARDFLGAGAAGDWRDRAAPAFAAAAQGRRPRS